MSNMAYNSLIAKDLPRTYDAPVKLSKLDEKKIERANELIKAGQDLWNELNQHYNPDNITNYKIDSIYNKDAYPILLKVAQKFAEGNALKYEVYHDNCVDFFKKHRYESPTGLENAKRFQKEAVNYIEKGQANRRAASYYVNEYAKAYAKYYEAISLEIIAVKKVGRALQIYQDWPVHYSYEWDEDIEFDLFNPPAVAVVKKEEPKPEPPKPVEEVKELPDSMIIFYQVQIAAHTLRISPKYISDNVYHGDMPVQEIKEDGWYKYTIGRYKTFEEANNLLKSVKIPKAFVVAYKNGKRVPIKEVNEQPVQKSLNAPTNKK